MPNEIAMHKAPSSWYRLESFASLGATEAKAQSLAGLHEARDRHLGQFWTPTHVAQFMWRVAEASMRGALDRGGEGAQVSLLDTSIGSGRLIQFADPALHVIGGVDVHGPVLDALSDNLSAAGFTFDLVHGGLQDTRVDRFDLALLNPPFSLHFETALLTPYPCTSFGRFGGHSSALSHAYALHQALDAAAAVIALVPRTYADEVIGDELINERLEAVFHLPGTAFASEGANVATSVLVFGRGMRRGAVQVHRVSDFDAAVPALDLGVLATGHLRQSKLSLMTVARETPAITVPVTGDKSVRIYRRGRFLKLGFACGLVQARVMNALLRKRIDRYAGEHRYPTGVETEGQGLFDLELHLMTPDPLASVARVVDGVREAGGDPRLDAAIPAYLARLARVRRRQCTSLRRCVFVPAGGDVGGALGDADSVSAVAKKTGLLNPGVWGSPMIKQGETVTLQRAVVDGAERFTLARGAISVQLGRAEALDRFDIAAASANEDCWSLLHPGRSAAYPQMAAALRRRALSLGLDRWLSWGYQLDDLIECAMTPGGVVAGWQMGLGKARLAAALCMLGQGRRNLVVVEASLIDEFVDELKSLGASPADWQVIAGSDALSDLRAINIISYSRLRMALPGRRKATYAAALRGRIHTLVADEAHCIANDSTQQVRALYTVNPKRRYGLTGTPIGNYPRNLLPLIVWVAGDGTAAQPYGMRRPYMESRLLNSMKFAARGIDAFRDSFVSIEWFTHAWAETMSDGAAREVPALRNLDQYRDYAARFVLRRVWEEPDVARFIKVPTPTREVCEIDWDTSHLSLYLTQVEEFADWWKDQREAAGASGKQLNLIAVLARIGAAFRAAQYPQGSEGPGGALCGLTSKQRWLINDLTQCAAEGRRTLCYATSPDLLELLQVNLARAGVGAELYTGKQNRKQRRASLARFKAGEISTLLVSFGVGSTGLNVPQATDELFANRCWSPRQEKQAEYRALRPQQKHRLRIRYAHLRGSLDEYMAQLCEMKADAARAGLDYGAPEYQASDFVSWISILDAFCDSVAKLRKVERHQLREDLKHAA